MTRPVRILVTGAGGFVGRTLLPRLRAGFPDAVLIGAGREAQVRGTDTSLPFDLLQPDAFADMVAAARPDAVLHMAAQADVAASFRNPVESWRANLTGTVAFGEAVLRVAPQASFLFVSSGEIYGLGFQAGLPLAEEAAFSPANPYAAKLGSALKSKAEQVAPAPEAGFSGADPHEVGCGSERAVSRSFREVLSRWQVLHRVPSEFQQQFPRWKGIRREALSEVRRTLTSTEARGSSDAF